MTNTPRFITLVGSILVIGIAATTGCSDDTTTDGTGGKGGSSTTGGSAGSGTTGGSAGSGTTGGSGGSDAAGGSGGGGTCPAPGFDDGDPCTFTGMCPTTCGIEDLGTRACACATTADCDSCMPPDATMYPITMPATACADIEDTIRDMPCDTAGAACIFLDAMDMPTNRGCACWEFATPGSTTWTCGSHNNWFAL